MLISPSQLSKITYFSDNNIFCLGEGDALKKKKNVYWEGWCKGGVGVGTNSNSNNSSSGNSCLQLLLTRLRKIFQHLKRWSKDRHAVLLVSAVARKQISKQRNSLAHLPRKRWIWVQAPALATLTSYVLSNWSVHCWRSRSRAPSFNAY